MAEVQEMADTLAEQMWDALAVFMNQIPDDLTDDHVKSAANEMGVPAGVSEHAMRMVKAMPLPSWVELDSDAQQAWWAAVIYQLMPILAGWSGKIQKIHLQGRN